MMNQAAATFFLPVVELIRRDKQWQLCVNLTADTDSQAILNQIIWQGRPLAPMVGQVSQETHTPTHRQWCHTVTRALSYMAHTELKKSGTRAANTLNVGWRGERWTAA